MNKWGLIILAMLIHAGISGYLIFASLPKPLDPSAFPPDVTEAPPRMWNFKTDSIDLLVKELSTEKEKLEEDKKNVIVMQSQVASERSELEKVRAEVKAIREEIEQRVVAVQDDEIANLKSLSTSYSTMPPPAAVAIMREMDENMAVKIISMMKNDKVSAILAEMGKAADRPGEDPMAKRAARISDKLRLAKPIKKQIASAS